MPVENSPAGLSRGCFPRLLLAGWGEGDALPRQGIRVQAHRAAFFPDLLEAVTRFFFFFLKGKQEESVLLNVSHRRLVYETL